MTSRNGSIVPGFCLLGTMLLITGVIAYENLRAPGVVKQITVQEQVQKFPVNDLGPLVFLESYNFHDKDMSYKVVRLETGERIFIAYNEQGVACIKIDKR